MVPRMTLPLANHLQRLVDQVSTIIVGKRPQIEDCIACLLAGGHLLIEDVPGVGKTTLAHALAVSLGLRFSRVQFTADLMPSDLIGAFLDRGSLYYSRSSVATLTKVGFTGSALTGTPVSIAAPPYGDWRSRTLFLGPAPS